MGCSLSIGSQIEPQSDSNSKKSDAPSSVSLQQTVWRKLLSKERALVTFGNDGTLPKGASDQLIELRVFLSDELLIGSLGRFVKSNPHATNLLLCWTEILEFKALRFHSEEFAKYLCEKYLFIPNSPNFISEVQPDEELYDLARKRSVTHEGSETFSSTKYASAMNMDGSIPISDEARSRMFDTCHQNLLVLINDTIFTDFKKTFYYHEALRERRAAYNRVEADSFEYYGLLGQGSFGFVVHCRKKSTGTHYAMKIQPKIGLLESYNDNPRRVLNERQAAAACRHNFITALDYAFQTQTLVMLVLELGTAGTLHDAQMQCPGRRMDIEHVRFYSAEIILALGYIHRMGLIHRDLKPQNVLVCADGHIKLLDMGGIVDVGGKVLGQRETNGVFSSRNMDVPVRKLSSCPSNIKNNGGDKGVAEVAPLNGCNGRSDCPCVGLGDVGSGVGAGVCEYVTMSQGSSRNRSRGASYVFSCGNKDRDSDDTNSDGDRAFSALRHADSIMGTGGYMAPEMLVLQHGLRGFSEGYNAAVDFWSLGITMYRLLVGEMPFMDVHVAQFTTYKELMAIQMETTDPTQRPGSMMRGEEKDKTTNIDQFGSTETNNIASLSTLVDDGGRDEALCNSKREVDGVQMKECQGGSNGRMSKTNSVKFPEMENCDRYVHPAYERCVLKLNKVAVEDFGCPDAMDAILGLLDVNPKRRLGAGARGKRKLRKHPFYDSVYWQLLDQKSVQPPTIPNERELEEDLKVHESFGSMMMSVGADAWLDFRLNSIDDNFFESWNYVAPRVLQRELQLQESQLESTKGLTKIPEVLRSKSALLEEIGQENVRSE